jgi:hypothetical protein
MAKKDDLIASLKEQVQMLRTKLGQTDDEVAHVMSLTVDPVKALAVQVSSMANLQTQYLQRWLRKARQRTTKAAPCTRPARCG